VPIESVQEIAPAPASVTAIPEDPTTSEPTATDPTTDPATGTASAVEVHVGLRLTLRERATGKTLYSRPNYEIRERYEISIDPAAYFEESDSALARASQQTAQQVVSSILEAF